MSRYDEDEDEILPNTNLHQISIWRQKLTDFLIPHIGTVVEGEACVRLVDALTKKIRTHDNRSIPEGALEASEDRVRTAVKVVVEGQLLQAFLDMQHIEPLVNTLAGNIPAFKAGVCVHLSEGRTSSEWVLARVYGAKPGKTFKRNIPGAYLTYDLLSGSPAGLQLEQFMSEDAINTLGVRLGVIARRDDRLLHPREVVGMHVLLKLKPSFKPEAERYKELGSLNKYNKHLALTRSNYELTCGFQSKWPCHLCPRGYKTCARGTHMVDYVFGECRNGHKGLFDPHGHSSTCLYCEAQRWRRRG